MGFIFRRIGGRIVPIKIVSELVKDNGLGSKELVTRAISKGKEVGKAGALLGNKARAKLTYTGVSDSHRGAGVAHAMFSEIVTKLKKLGYKFLHGEIHHPAQVAVRSKYASRFYDPYGGVFGDRFKFVKQVKAADRIKEKGYVMAVTKLGKLKKK